MEHLLLKAATTVATDEGVFTAVISSASVDREKDVVSPAGMVRALHKWAALGKRIPLAWNHSTAAADQIGYIDPASTRVQGSEVVASGWIDQTSDVGREAWRSVKAGTLGFSFGYLIPAGGATKRKGGGREINELDVFEITATGTPMNNDTRVLGWKGIKAAGTVGPAARHHLENLIKYYMSKPHPFTECVHDNAKRFGPDGADKVCATLKDIGTGTTHWRHGGKPGKALADAVQANGEPTQEDMDGMCQSLYEASDGNLEGLLEMWHAYQIANGDTPKAILNPDELRAEAAAISHEFSLRGARKQADTEDEDDPAELLGQMISMAQDFIDDEDDTTDVAVMRQVMALLLKLQAGEASETPDDTTAKALDDAAEVSRQFARKAERSKVHAELAELREERDEHAARVKQLEADLAAANEKLTERTPDIDTLRRFSDAAKLDAVKGGNDHARKVAAQAAEELSSAYSQQAERLKSVEEELAGARKQLEERTGDLDMLKRAGDALTLGAVKRTRRRKGTSGAEWVVPEAELAGAKSGELKAVWTTAYINNLPDSSFLHVEGGGSKDSDGKTTPRSLRHFPYKDASGAVDMAHLRNALARIPQSNLPQDVKDRLTARAQNILDNQKALAVDPDVAVDVTGRGREPHPVDPLVQTAKALAADWRGHGISRPKPPRSEDNPTRPEPPNEDELRREMRALVINALSGNRS